MVGFFDGVAIEKIKRKSYILGGVYGKDKILHSNSINFYHCSVSWM
jgi:hypothetical protein